MRFQPPLLEAVLLKRYKRFLSDIVFPDGREARAHCANTGSMKGVSKPGSKVYVSESSNPARKLKYTLEAIRANRRWVGIHPLRANAVVEEALNLGNISELSGFESLKREPRLEDGGRSDFLLEGRIPTWVEVKYVTLAEGTRALFPDSVSVRATRHVNTLMKLVSQGNRGVILLVSPRSDVTSISPADDIDPNFGTALRKAAHQGVEVLGYRLALSRRDIRLTDPLPVDLSPASMEEPSRSASSVIG